MNGLNVSLKYKIDDIVLYKNDSKILISTGKIENILVSFNKFRELDVCYYIKNLASNQLDIVNETKILNVANNVVNKEVMRGEIAESYAEAVLKDFNLNIKIIKIEFEGSKTAVTYKMKDSLLVRKEISECHPNDNFEKSKGVMACLCKISIRLLKNKLYSL